jgi:hypothetical protein
MDFRRPRWVTSGITIFVHSRAHILSQFVRRCADQEVIQRAIKVSMKLAGGVPHEDRQRALVATP